jgi:catechol 2,3-dioxygenase-like lactoylglutathione lyase family enzyme
MQSDLAAKLIDDYEQGRLSRRQLVGRLLGLGAAMAMLEDFTRGQTAGQGGAADAEQATFQATGLDHIALDVTDMARSREFYIKHLGLRVIRGDENALFLGADRDFFLTLFRADRPGLNHYCYAIKKYDPDDAFERLADAGLRPRRTGNRVYFPDPDGLTVQVTGR